jgi:hypothetical protein
VCVCVCGGDVLFFSKSKLSLYPANWPPPVLSNRAVRKAEAVPVGKDYPLGEDFPLRPHDPTVTEYLITIFVAGKTIGEIRIRIYLPF